MYLTGTMRINEKGHLEIGGIDAVELAAEFKTPLWVIDEQGFRENCRRFKEAFSAYGDSLVIYASKSLSCLALVKIAEEEGLGLDVVSGGEIFTALKAGFPMDKVFFHGNNKSREELVMALETGVGRIVVDNFYELELLNHICSEMGKKQDIMLRITPGVEAHTHEYIKTGQIDSKFGFTLPDGQALEGVRMALDCKWLNLKGLHCHIGSQIFEMASFRHATGVMMDFYATVKNELGLELDELDMGGGFGIFYYKGDEPCDPKDWAEAVMLTVREKADEYNLKMPRVIVEPGRAISGPAGITLYTIGSRKEVKGIRKYVAVDGGMGDNPRPALYGAKYTAILANKADKPVREKVSIAGKCCESGDMLIWDIELPTVEPGDILAVFATGAYNYAMSSNYNRLPRPAMVLVNEGKAEVIVKRETYEDIIRNDVLPERLRK
ncbi:diaminopimelate decarboxylase [Thermosyntropha lipolytica DSM 11003]|uniref:Diaminopimelate decarboxylase n=1 Tax=Thermosyntropha lipolytica DSM 11003 TaxID=1123382 RepID=A0A1M5PAF5_9FIRM|nr:diaminopimelate decarboxylase [Thermosyntropha lipolytica]SHG98223.1 diaminopimelate decarboxylase [Thermosyntropha lipolytica DSM 11003]